MENINNYSFDVSEDDKNLSTMKLIIDNETYQKRLDDIVEEYKPRMDIKGFRKGKAPKEIILKQYGESLEHEMQEKMIQESWDTISKEKKVETLSMPNLTNLKKEDDGLHISFEYYKLPDFTLPDFTQIKVEKNIYEVSDKTLAEAYKLEIKKYSQFVEDNAATIEIGYKVTIDINFEKEEYKKYNKEVPVLASDSKEDIYYSTQILGMKIDETKTVTTFVAEDSATVVLTIKKIEKPDMKDDTKEEDKSVMKEELKKKITENATKKSDNDLTLSIIDSIVSNATINIPEGYLEMKIEDSVKKFDESLKQQNMSIEEYTASLNKKMSEFRKEESEEVKKSIIRDIIFQKVLDEKKDEVSIDEAGMNQYAEQMYQYYNYMGLNKRPKDEQSRIVNSIMNDAQNRFASEAVIEYLKKIVSITEKTSVEYKAEMEDYKYGY